MEDLRVKLQEAQRSLAAMSFPRVSADPLLRDFIVELVDYDSYIAGLVSQIIDGNLVLGYPLKDTGRFRSELATLRHQGAQSDAVDAIGSYLNQLDRVVSAATRVLGGGM